VIENNAASPGTTFVEQPGYQPLPPREFRSRGSSDKRAAYKHQNYLKHRVRILTDRHAESAKKPKTPRTTQQRKRMSAAKKRSWQEMSEASKSLASRGLKAGRDKQAEMHADRRRELGWPIIKQRLENVGVRVLKSKFGRIVYPVLAEVGLTKRKQFYMDRGGVFTRGAATDLRVSLGDVAAEFAARISTPDNKVRAARPLHWLTDPDKSVEEAPLCIALRDRLATELLGKETIRRASPRDRYSRPAMLVTLFPHIRSECKLLVEVMHRLSAFLKRHDGEAREKQIVSVVIEAGRKFRTILYWFPKLLPWVLQNQRRIREASVPDERRGLVYELLASTCSCSAKIVRAALSNETHAIEPGRMRELLRLYIPKSEPTAVQPKIKTRMGGRKKLGSEQDSRSFRLAKGVFDLKARMQQGIVVLRRSKKESPDPADQRRALTSADFNPIEVEALLTSETAIGAAQHCVALIFKDATHPKGLRVKTVWNAWSKFRSKFE
jgi:hypothetical protein